MDYLNEHRQKFIEEFPVTIKNLSHGDIARFIYDGQQRWVMILNPMYRNKIHALALECIPRTMLIRVSQLVGKDVEPKVLYSTYIARQPALHNMDAYRTFDIPKVGDPHLVIYDYGFNTANPHTILAWDRAIVLGVSETDDVYADTYKTIKTYAEQKAGKEGFYTPLPMTPGIIQFIQQIKKPKFVTTWVLHRNEGVEDAAYEEGQMLLLGKLVNHGGVFFMSDKDIDKFNAENKRLVSI